MSLVLVVDDHVDTCHIMTKLIRLLGPNAECVHSGIEALAFVRQITPSLILLDISMPGRDGFETLERLRASAEGAAVPVIICSAVTDDAARRRARNLGAADYLPKSNFNFDALADMLGQYVPVRSWKAEGSETARRPTGGSTVGGGDPST